MGVHGVFNGPPLRLTSPVDLNSAPTSEMSRCPTPFRDFAPPLKKTPQTRGTRKLPRSWTHTYSHTCYGLLMGMVSGSIWQCGSHVLGGPWNFSLTGWETGWDCLFSSRHDGNVFDFSGWNDGVDVEWMNGRREVSDGQGTWSPGTCFDSKGRRSTPTKTNMSPANQWLEVGKSIFLLKTLPFVGIC